MSSPQSNSPRGNSQLAPGSPKGQLATGSPKGQQGMPSSPSQSRRATSTTPQVVAPGELHHRMSTLTPQQISGALNVPAESIAEDAEQPSGVEGEESGSVVSFTKHHFGNFFRARIKTEEEADKEDAAAASSDGHANSLEKARKNLQKKQRRMSDLHTLKVITGMLGLADKEVQQDQVISEGDLGEDSDTEEEIDEDALADVEAKAEQDLSVKRDCTHTWKTLEIFADWPHDTLVSLCNAIHVIHMPAENHRSREGDSKASLLFVFSGEVDVFARGRFVRNVTAGSYVGETRLLGIEKAKGLSITAVVPTIICEITRHDFLEVLKLAKSHNRKDSTCQIQQHNRNKTFKRSKTLLASNSSIDFDSGDMNANGIKKQSLLEKFEEIREQHRGDMTHGVMTQTCPLLTGISMRTLIEIDMIAVERLYFPGERIIQLGSTGNEFFILVKGKASVLNSSEQCVRQLVGNGNDVACFGERVFLGIEQVHSTSVIADTVCLSRNVQRSVFAELLSQQQEAIHLSQVQEIISQTEGTEIVASEFGVSEQKGVLYRLEMGRGFIDWIAAHCKERLFLDKQMLIDPALPCDNCLFIITKGHAEVDLNAAVECPSDPIILNSGALIGEHVPLGFKMERTAAVRAVGTTCAWVIHDYTLHNGLREFPEEKEKVLLLTFANRELGKVAHSGVVSPAACLKHTRNIAMKSMIDTVQNAMWASPLFSGVSAKFVELLAQAAESNTYLPGDEIAAQGEMGDSMFIMISGQANVFFKDPTGDVNKVGNLTAGSICGELTMLGISPVRTATIVAETMCTFWEITQSQATSLLEELPAEIEMFANIVIRNLEQSVLRCIQTVPTFTAFDSKFKTLIYMCCSRRAYWGGSCIANQGEPGDGLYIINRGLAVLSAKAGSDQAAIKQAGEGHCFGAGMMLGLHKNCPCSMMALNICHVLVITHAHYLLALDRYPSEKANKELRAAEKITLKGLANKIEELGSKKRVMRRSIMLGGNKEVDMSLVRSIYLYWHHEAHTSAKKTKQWNKMQERYARLQHHKSLEVAKGHELRKLKQLEKDAMHSRGGMMRIDEDISKRSPREKKISGADPYGEDPFVLEKDFAPCKVVVVQGDRCKAATSRHMSRRIAAKTPCPQFGSQRLPPKLSPSHCAEVLWFEDDPGKPPSLLPGLAPKSVVNAFVLKPVLCASTIDSAR